MMHSGLRRIEATLNQLNLEEVSASRSAGMAHLGVCSESLSNCLQESWQDSIQKSWQGSFATSRSSSGSTSSNLRSTLDVSHPADAPKTRTIQPFPLSKETESLPMKRFVSPFVSPSLACGWAERSPHWSNSESVEIESDSVGTEKARKKASCHENEIGQTHGGIAASLTETHGHPLESDFALVAPPIDSLESRGIAIASRIFAAAKSKVVKPFAVDEQGPRLSLPKVKGAAESQPLARQLTQDLSPQPTTAQPAAAPTPVEKQLQLAHSPGIAKVLKGIAATIAAWQADLAQVVQQIQALYEEGPILEGWLESRSHEFWQPSQRQNTATLRHAEVEDLMAYVESICQDQPMQVIGEPRTDYRLCGLNEDGHLWSRPCPAEQVPYVSLAIARYQKLRTLLADKQELEHRLNQLIQSLTILHGEAQQG